MDLIKEFLREKIGSTFQECTVRSDENLLEVDSATWGGMRHMRENTPWKQMERGMEDYIGSMCVIIWAGCVIGTAGGSLAHILAHVLITY